jgi:hypothetical protein
LKKLGIEQNGNDRAGEEQHIVAVNFDEIQVAMRQ